MGKPPMAPPAPPTVMGIPPVRNAPPPPPPPLLPDCVKFWRMLAIMSAEAGKGRRRGWRRNETASSCGQQNPNYTTQIHYSVTTQEFLIFPLTCRKRHGSFRPMWEGGEGVGVIMNKLVRVTANILTIQELEECRISPSPWRKGLGSPDPALDPREPPAPSPKRNRV